MTDMSYEAMEQRRKDRMARSKAIEIREGDMVLVERTEAHLHKGHEYEFYEALRDNAVEGTVWYYCHTCKTDFWWSSVEIAQAPW